MDSSLDARRIGAQRRRSFAVPAGALWKPRSAARRRAPVDSDSWRRSPRPLEGGRAAANSWSRLAAKRAAGLHQCFVLLGCRLACAHQRLASRRQPVLRGGTQHWLVAMSLEGSRPRQDDPPAASGQGRALHSGLCGQQTRMETGCRFEPMGTRPPRLKGRACGRPHTARPTAGRDPPKARALSLIVREMVLQIDNLTEDSSTM